VQIPTCREHRSPTKRALSLQSTYVRSQNDVLSNILSPNWLFDLVSHTPQTFQTIKMATVAANFTKKMQALRTEADQHQAKAHELQAKVKTLEQETLAKEQEITSLTHRNQLLEGQIDKLDTAAKEAKDAAGQVAQHGQQNETLQRKLQLLEEEAEEADKTLRETNDKYKMQPLPNRHSISILTL
jgi:tropomyosin, fungi type